MALISVRVLHRFRPFFSARGVFWLHEARKLFIKLITLKLNSFFTLRGKKLNSFYVPFLKDSAMRYQNPVFPFNKLPVFPCESILRRYSIVKFENESQRSPGLRWSMMHKIPTSTDYADLARTKPTSLFLTLNSNITAKTKTWTNVYPVKFFNSGVPVYQEYYLQMLGNVKLRNCFLRIPFKSVNIHGSYTEYCSMYAHGSLF